MRTDVVGDILRLPSQFPGIRELPHAAVYLLGCRTFDQFCSTLRALGDPRGFCPFCVTELTRRNRRPLAKATGWMLLENEYPHRNTSRMLLIVPERHVTTTSDLNPQDWTAIGYLFARAGVPSGGWMFRFGDPRMNVGTIPHLHINLVEPIPGKEYRPPFAKNTVEHKADYDRLNAHIAELGRRGGAGWLFSADGIRETEPSL